LFLSGSITALASPFAPDGRLDLDAWSRLLAAQVEGGSSGVADWPAISAPTPRWW
jgi:4-hydroxy-tetrahydrodipicolinate synthase